jgi:enamine deaminase RidA (YjgF/YER057c/UK114 family)
LRNTQLAVFEGFDQSAMDVVSIPLPGCQEEDCEHFVTMRNLGGMGPRAMLESLASVLKEKRAAIVLQTIVGDRRLYAETMQAQRDVFGEIAWPVMWLGGAEGSVSGIQVHAVSGMAVTPILWNGAVAGTSYQDAYARYCVLGGLHASDLSLPGPQQTREVFERMQAVLESEGMDFNCVARTWLYPDDILAWYGDFNAARSRFFEECVAEQLFMPASTGIGVPNPHGAALIAGALAVQPIDAGVLMTPVASPLQCAAIDYKSSFSRAVEIDHAGMRKLYVSGTASIEPQGRTAHIGDVEKQIFLTMNVVQAILTSRSMDWSHVTRGIAYAPDPATEALFEQCCERLGLRHLPLLWVQSDICRDDLLFEIEVAAARG